jgi:hypothetical protein
MRTATTKNGIDRDDGTVVVAVKTPLMPKPTTARLPGRLSVRQAVEQLQREKPKDAQAARILQQLAREMTDVHHFLAVRSAGIEKVDPGTTLDQIALPREIRSNDGIEVVRVAAFEVQSYAKVGVDEATYAAFSF